MKLKSFLGSMPVFLLSVGVGFVLLSTATVLAALGMSASVIVVFVLTALCMKLVDKFVSAEYRLFAAMIVGVGFSVLVNLLMQAFLPAVASELGVFAAVVGIEAANIPCEDKDGVKLNTVVSALLSGVAFTVIAVISAVIREILGSASVFGVKLGFLDSFRLKTLAGAFGAYVVVAAVLACFCKLSAPKAEKEGK